MARVIDDVLASRRGTGKSQVVGGGERGNAARRTPLKTVVKGRYRTMSSKGPNPARGRASAVMRNVDYMTTRPDHSHQRISRDVVMPDRTINLQNEPEHRRLLEEQLVNAKEKYIYHVILSSGDKSMFAKDVELWAKAVLQSQGIDRYYMVIHAGEKGHTSNPHAHIVIPTNSRLEREDFFNFRKVGDLEQQFHRQLFRGLEEAWSERFNNREGSSGSGGKQVEHEEEKGTKKRGIDVQFG